MTGIIRLCHLFIASVSRPYHMAVALGIATLALFTYPYPPAYRDAPSLVIQIAGDANMTTENILKLLTRHVPEGH